LAKQSREAGAHQRSNGGCAAKEYLDNGAVKFRDNCTGEYQTTVRQGAVGSRITVSSTHPSRSVGLKRLASRCRLEQ